MHAQQTNAYGEDFVGLMGLATDKYAIVSPGFKDTKSLGVPTLKTKIYGSNLAGMFCQGNSNGLLVPYFVSDTELETLKKFSDEIGFEIGKIDSKYTALGNMIAANDNAALVSPSLRRDDTISDVLGVEVKAAEVAGSTETGAYVLATNKGFITHPKAEDQLTELKNVFEVEGMTGTVNYGVPFVKSGIIANSKGYITGTRTTGIELQRIDDALGFM